MKRFLYLLVTSLFPIAFAFGQLDTGQITGAVTDVSGAVIGQATITVVNANTGLSRTTVTSANGIFILTGLPAGDYKMTIGAAGFGSITQTVTVSIGGSQSVDVRLAVQSAVTVVQVQATATTINTESPEVSQVINSQELRNLPSLTRNAYDFVALSGNVTGDPNGSTNANGVGVAINGGRSASTEILLDGVENVNLFAANVGQTIPLDAVSQYRVITNGFSAEYGRASGGIVNLATRSGGNQLHGSLYEYNRISALAANTYQENSVNFLNRLNGDPLAPSDHFVRNQFGYAVGGPILRNKLFFFSNTEWIRVRSTGTQFAYIPTQEYLATTAANTQAFFTQFGKLKPGAVLGAASTDHPQFQLVTFPAATDEGADDPQNSWETLNRFDWNISDKTTLFGRYGLDSLDFAKGTVTYSPFDGYDTGETDYNQALLISLTHVFTPHLISGSKISYNRFNQYQGLSTAPIGPTLYTNGTSLNSINNSTVVFPGYSAYTPGNSVPFGGPQNLYEFDQDLSWTKGAHNFHFGGAFIQLRDNRVFGAYENSVSALARTSGSFFTSSSAAIPSGLENLTNGQMYQFQGAVYPQGKFPCNYTYNPSTGKTTQDVNDACTLTLPVGPPSFERQNTFNDGSVYAQDTWRVTPTVTLTAGLRWEYYGVQHNSDPNLESNFYMGSGSTIYDQIRNGQVLTTPHSPVGGLIAQSKKNFAPRIGFAWDVFGDGKWSVRGGYGISYERNFGNVTYNVIQNPPNYGVVSVVNQSVNNGSGDVASLPITTDNAGPLAGTGTKALPRVSLRAVAQNIPVAYANQYNLAVQHQITSSGVLSVEYSASRGIHQYTISNINRQYYGNIFLGDDAENSPGNALNYQYSNINFRGANGDSYYQSMNIRFEANNLANQGLQIVTNYTLGRSMDTLSSTFSQSENNFNLGNLDPFNVAYDRGNSDFDARQRITLGAVYEPKFLDMHNASTTMRAVAGGWTFAPIFSANSGTAFTIYDCTNAIYTCPRIVNAPGLKFKGNARLEPGVANSFNFIDIPVASQNLYVDPIAGASDMPTCNGGGNTSCWLNPGLGRNQWYGPAFWNLDFGTYKTFHLGERYNLQLRGEFYNIFNHHNLFVNGSTADYAEVSSVQAAKGSRGGISGPGDERRNIQLALRFEF